MATEISSEKLNRVVKCLIRIHHIEGGDEVERFRDMLLGFRKQELLDLIQVCKED